MIIIYNHIFTYFPFRETFHSHNILLSLWLHFSISLSTQLDLGNFDAQTARVLTVCSCHVTYAFESESTLYSCLNVKELLARSRREIWRWSDCNWTRTQASLVKWLSVRLRTKWFWVRVQLQEFCLVTFGRGAQKPSHFMQTVQVSTNWI